MYKKNQYKRKQKANRRTKNKSGKWKIISKCQFKSSHIYKNIKYKWKKTIKMKIYQPGLKKNSTVCHVQVTHFKSKET